MGNGPGRTWYAAALGLAAAAITLLAMACGGGGGSSPASPTPPTYTVTYSGNGSTGGSAPLDSGTYQQGQTVTVLGNSGSLVKAGSSFTGWNTVAGGTGSSYAQGQTFTMGTANVTLYAKWATGPATYTVTYIGNGSDGGSVPVDATAYQQGAMVTVLGNTGSLVKTGNTFTGWNTVAGGTGTAYTAGQTFTMGAAGVTLYAQWSAATGQGFAYTVNQYEATVSQLSIGSNGALAALAPPSVACELDPNSLAVDPSGKYLYVVNLKGATSTSYGSISQYTIGADGKLAPMAPAAVAEGGLFTDIAVHPTGKWAYAPSSNNSKSTVVQNTLGTTGALTTTSTTPGGLFPVFLAIHPSGNFLYVADSAFISQYTINPTTGALTAMTPATVPAFNTGGHTTFAITVHPSGKYAYVTDYYGGILEYTIDAVTGALSQLAQTKVDGPIQGAAWITVDPTGKYAYVANEGSTTAAISQFTIGADGTLTAMTPASVAATSPGTNIQVDATGTHLYMTSGFGAGATNIVTQYLIGANGALTPMTPATVFVGSGPNAIVLVKK